MKVIHWGSLDTKSGGPALSTYLTLKGLMSMGVDASIVCHPLSASGHLIGSDVEIKFSEPIKEPRFGYIPRLGKTLNDVGLPDIYHIQGLWQYPGHKMASFARKHRVPYVVTLRGMMYPQALAHSAKVKKVSLALYQRHDLVHAAAIQCTCEEEMEHYRAMGFKNPVAIIPNPVEMPESAVRVIPTTFTIGYLGRLHPRKRVERLIYALQGLPNAHLIIIGGNDEVYEQFLRNEASRLGLCDRVEFAGFLVGEAKADAIRSLSVLAVPSDFENFGNIVTEALSYKVPVIASKGMPWQVLTEKDCGWWIDNDQSTINKTLQAVSELSDEQLIAMGERGYDLVQREFSVEALGEKMRDLYRWVFEGGELPEFVYV